MNIRRLPKDKLYIGVAVAHGTYGEDEKEFIVSVSGLGLVFRVEGDSYSINFEELLQDVLDFRAKGG